MAFGMRRADVNQQKTSPKDMLSVPRLHRASGHVPLLRTRDGRAKETIMAKGQRRGNREIRKPKANREVVVAPSVSLIKPVVAMVSAPKKKG